MAWALTAKNLLQNVHDFTPNHLVFGTNPNFPPVFNDKSQALEGKTSSDIIVDNLNVMHVVRKAFIEAEASEKIRRALCHNVRTSGDTIFHKRNKCDRWAKWAASTCKTRKHIILEHIHVD